MKKKFKSILSIFMALIMIFAIFPVADIDLNAAAYVKNKPTFSLNVVIDDDTTAVVSVKLESGSFTNGTFKINLANNVATCTKAVKSDAFKDICSNAEDKGAIITFAPSSETAMVAVASTIDLDQTGEYFLFTLTKKKELTQSDVSLSVFDIEADVINNLPQTVIHSWSAWRVTKSATCTAKGTEKRTCSTCGATESRDIPIKNHSYTTKVIAPTCTEKGYTIHICSGCGDSYKDNYISETGHHYTAYITKKPTCTAKGVKTYMCLCGDTYTETIPALGHSFGEWIVIKPSTYAETGVEIRFCSRCSACETQDIPKPPAPKVELNNHNLSINYKDKTQLISSVKNVEWTSSNINVAIVDSNGKVTATGTGNVVIKATIKGTDISDSCQISVSYAWWQWIIEILLLGFLWY